MPNKNYNRGRAYEYARMKFWRNHAYEVLRTAGSHGPFDLIVVPLGSDPVMFIQCKRVETLAAANRLIEAFKAKPPIPLKWGQKFQQHIEVYVSSTRQTVTSWASNSGSESVG